VGRMEDDIRDLQRLSKMDLVVLLGKLGEELERIEVAYHDSEKRRGELEQTAKELQTDNKALLGKNTGLVEQLQGATEKLLKLEENPVNWQTLMNINQQMIALKEQNEKQGELLRTVLQTNTKDSSAAEQADAVKLAGDRARMLLEDARKRAAAINIQIQKSNMDMFTEMQESIARAKSRCEAAIKEEESSVSAFSELEKTLSSSVEPRQQPAEAASSGDQIVLDAGQAQHLLSILNRFKKMRDGVF